MLDSYVSICEILIRDHSVDAEKLEELRKGSGDRKAELWDEVLNAKVVGDVDSSGKVDIVDVQCSLVLGLAEITGDGKVPDCAGGDLSVGDVNCDQSTNVVDSMLVIQQVLEKPFSKVVDSNQNQCPDLCETSGDTPQEGDPCAWPENNSLWGADGGFPAVCSDEVPGQVELVCDGQKFVPPEQFLPCMDCHENEAGQEVAVCATPGFVGISQAGRAREVRYRARRV